MHVAVCYTGLPLNILTGLGSQHGSKKFIDVMGGVKIKVEIGRPRTKPSEVVADAAYDDTEIREDLRRRNIRSNMEETASKRDFEIGSCSNRLNLANGDRAYTNMRRDIQLCVRSPSD